MPRGRKSNGATSLSNAERQARYRARHQTAEPSVVIRTRQPVDRRPRPRRWPDAVTELVALQAAYAAWLEALPDTLRGTATAEALQVIVDVDLDRWPRSSRRAATAATDEMQWFRRMHGRPRMLGENDAASRAALRTPASAGFGP